MLNRFIHNRYFILVSAIVLLILAESLGSDMLFQKKREQNIEHFKNELQNKEKKLKTEVEELKERLKQYDIEEIFASYDNYYKDLFHDEGLAFLVYKNEQLSFWSTHHLKTGPDIVTIENPVIEKHGSAWYEVVPEKENNWKIFGFILLKRDFEYHNQYLESKFQKQFRIDDKDFNLSFEKSGKSWAIQAGGGSTTFYLNQNRPPEKEGPLLLLMVIAAAFGLFLFFLYLHREFKSVEKRTNAFGSGLLYIVFILGLRYVMISLHFPTVFYELELFGPGKFAASDIFSSLGDFLLNAFIFFYLSYFFFSKFKLKLKLKLNKYLTAVILLAFVFFISQLITYWLTGLIENSNISFNVNNLFSLDGYSLCGFLIIALMLFSHFLIVDKIITTIRLSSLSLYRSALVYIGVSLLLFYPVNYIFHLDNIVYWFWSFPILLNVLWVKTKKGRVYSFTGIMFLLLLFSGFAAYLLEYQTGEKEKEERKLLSQKLAEEKDPVAEYLFIETGENLKKDDYLNDSLQNYWERKKAIDEYINDNYFNGFWVKYDINITACRKTDSLLINPDNILVHCHDYFNEQLKKGQDATGTGFYYMGGEEEGPNYIASIEILDSRSGELGPVTLFVEFYSKYYPRGEGYPELLLDKEELNKTIDLQNYSYAKYFKGNLISSTGDYNYPLDPYVFISDEEGYKEVVWEGYHHLQYKSPAGTVVVISRVKDQLIDRVTTFSYLFAFFSLLMIVPVVTIKKLPFRYNFALSDFNTKIQLFLVTSILIAIILFGLGTTYYIKKQYHQKNLGNISEKTRSILIEVEHKLGREEQLNVGMKDYMNYILVKFSNVFYTDINLYNKKGELLSSSRPEVFESGLVGDRMDITAYKQMAIHKKTEFIHREKIGNLEYLSAYVPFRNEDGKLLAYLNLPYFAKQNQLEEEISAFLVALINIYVFLFALSIVVAVVFANYISRPLRLIRSKIGKLQLGKSNELIEWKGDDEIGSLVKEYNRMVEELAKSAELLAKTERESAWREMARQVAHEIKNPLTPMRLSIQHLQRSSTSKDPDIKKRIDKTANTLIEQIDTLSAIASEFSNFAKMPKAKKGKVDLPEVIRNAVSLYREQEDEAEILFENEADNKYVHADIDQLRRVFNNLVKNALQAIPDERKGKIKIVIGEDGGSFLVTVRDNGEGISEPQLDKIFAPNFTTKTGGMGLGLAMVKNIIEQSGGDIWFDTTEGKGTTFFISLPVMK